MQDGILCPNDTEALELRPWINANHKRLILWLLLVRELHVEQAELVALGSSVSTLEQVASLSRRTRHEWNPTPIHNWYSHASFSFPTWKAVLKQERPNSP
jgi:hypothetical protein